MGADGAVNIIYRKSWTPRRTPPRPAKLVEEYDEKFANPYVAAGLGYLDDVIEPRETRPQLIERSTHARAQAPVPPREEARQHPL